MRTSYRITLMALLLAACSGPPAQAVENTPAAPTVAAASAVTEPPVVTEAVAATEMSTAAAPTATRAPRLELEATDPSTVSLAAGKPQLVEFFAFW